jgi:hypothetical protein
VCRAHAPAHGGFVSAQRLTTPAEFGLANNNPAASGASQFAILGRAVQPPWLAVVDPS